jgi:phage-related protein
MNKAIRISPPNLMSDWGYVESWSAGDSSAPDGWAMSGTAGSVAKEDTTIKYGSYSMKIISGSSNSYKATYSHSDYDDYEGKTITFGMWVKCSTASKARIYIYDGTTTTNSSYHAGDGEWEWIEVEGQIGASNTELTFGCEVQSSTITAYFDGGVAVDGEVIFTELSGYVEGWKPNIKYSATTHEIARRYGVHMSDVKLKDRSIRIRANVAESAFTTTRTTYDSLVKALTRGKKDLYLYDDRIIEAYLTSLSYDYLASLRMIRFDLQFACPEPTYRYCGKLRNSETISSSPTSFNFEYDGNQKSFPFITFTASGNDITSCTLENLTTKQSMSFTDTVSDGDDLTIDCDKIEVLNDTTDSIDAFSGDFLHLVPGTNYMKFTGSNCIIKIDWWDKWL